jgi:hypothetical protein
MNNQDIRDLIQSELKSFANGGQYGVSQVPTHIHNRIDSPAIQATLIDWTRFMMWGTTSGNAVISNSNITPNSIVLVSQYPGGNDVVGALCGDGTMTLSNALNIDVDYLIIFNPQQ